MLNNQLRRTVRKLRETGILFPSPLDFPWQNSVIQQVTDLIVARVISGIKVVESNAEGVLRQIFPNCSAGSSTISNPLSLIIFKMTPPVKPVRSLTC